MPSVRTVVWRAGCGEIRSQRITQNSKEQWMKTLTNEIWMEVPARRAIVSIHNEVKRLVAESDVQDGLVLVNPSQIQDTRPQHHI